MGFGARKGGGECVLGLLRGLPGRGVFFNHGLSDFSTEVQKRFLYCRRKRMMRGLQVRNLMADIGFKAASDVMTGAKLITDIGVRLLNGRSKLLQRLYMAFVMAFVLRACPSDEVIKSLHLHGHVFHLCINNLDSFFMYRFSGCLNRSIALINCLE